MPQLTNHSKVDVLIFSVDGQLKNQSPREPITEKNPHSIKLNPFSDDKKSLNRDMRKRELLKITLENYVILTVVIRSRRSC